MSGRKYDGAKAPVVQGFMHYFARAIKAVALVSKYGKEKYKTEYFERNWDDVEDGLNRYTDADGRHLLDEAIDGPYDPESHLLHAAHHAWDAMARLEKLLAAGVSLVDPEQEKQADQWTPEHIASMRAAESAALPRIRTYLGENI